MKSASPAGRGRRPGNPHTKDDICDAARRQFLTQGYQETTLRAIAAEAGVDPALINYYFGSKQGLFGAAMALTVNPPEMLHRAIAGDLATLPERLVATLVTAWDDPTEGEPLRVLVAAAAHEPAVARLVREVIETEMTRQLTERLGGRDASARAAAFGAQLAGLILSRYWLRVEPLASMPIHELIRYTAPGLHAAIRGPRDRATSPPR